MPATPVWMAAAEAALNRNIAISTSAAALATRLEGTSLRVEVGGMAPVRAAVWYGRLGLMIEEISTVEAGWAAPNPGIGATTGAASPASAVISGSAPALLQMMRGSTPSGSVQIRGDAEIANSYRALFAAARPDLEEELSRWVGDMPARHLSLLAKSVRTWARRARRTAGENIAEYLQEEGRDLVTKTEMEEFLRGVDTVRDALDRIDVRLKGMESRVNGSGVNGNGVKGPS